MATIEELLLIGKEKLDKNDIDYSKYERKILLEEVLGVNYMYMLVNGKEEVSKEKEEQYMYMIDQRCKHYPLQYLLGYANFMDFKFYVNRNVLIPRSDTEILVERVLTQLKKIIMNKKNEQFIKVLDLCCGSGCIGISLKNYCQEIDLTLSDISKEALDVTLKNLNAHGCNATISCGDLFEGIHTKQDMIVSNPPYIERHVIDSLMKEVKEFEPMLALDGGNTGLDFYNKIIEQAPNYLNNGGWLFFEIGYNQGKVVSELMKNYGFQDVIVSKDYANLDRVVYGHL